MNHLHLTAIIAASLFLISGCGTLLSISETQTTEMNPDALVINRPAKYIVKPSLPDGSEFKKQGFEIKSIPDTINGVDHDHVITLNVKRMPFASGKLSVELTGTQLMKKVELTSQTGADRAANAVKSGFDARNDIVKNRKEAKKAAEGSGN